MLRVVKPVFWSISLEKRASCKQKEEHCLNVALLYSAVLRQTLAWCSIAKVAARPVCSVQTSLIASVFILLICQLVLFDVVEHGERYQVEYFNIDTVQIECCIDCGTLL